MKYYVKKYQEPYEPLNKNYPEEVMKYWWLGDDKKFKEAVKNYDNYYGTILPEAEITGSKTTPAKTSDWTSEHNVAEDNKKYEQAHQAESLKIASAVSNKMNEVGNTIGTTALIGGMTIPALVASPVAFAGGMLGGIVGAKATDKIVDWGTNGKYNTWADLLVDKADTKYINHNIAEILNPGALVGGTVGGIFTKPAASWAYRNGKYAYNTKFKGVAKGGDMSEYVPQTIKNQVESGVQGTKDQLKELGMINLPNSKITYKNTPIYNSFLDNIGNMTIGFDSLTLRNPFKFYKAYIGSSKPGLTYNFVGGHEYAHTVHPTKIGLYSEEGIPITSTTVGTPREFPIGERSLVKNNNNKLSVIDEYVTADKQLLEADLFKDINVPRKNIMKGLPNKSHNLAHLRAPLELDADLYALKNLGYIKDGKISDKGLLFLMERHNLSKEGVLNTITDLNTIGYGNAITGQPINSLYIPKPESINMGFAGAYKKAKSELTNHLLGDDAVRMFKEYGGEPIPQGSINGVQILAYIPEVRQRYGLVGNQNITDDEIAKALYKHIKELGGNTAAVNVQGEPLLLFRGSTSRHDKLIPKGISELSVSGADNILGNLFLGLMPHTVPGGDEGVGRYLGKMHGWLGPIPPLTKAAEVILPESKILAEDMYTLYTSKKFGDVKKLPGYAMSTGYNDINAFIVRTPSVRDATDEIVVLNPFETIPVDKRLGSTPSEHYKALIKDAELNNQGLIHSKPVLETRRNGTSGKYRDEHEYYDYFALPNFNIQNAKHILPYDFRIPRDWSNPNIYKAAIPIIGIGGLGLGLEGNSESYKQGGSIKNTKK